MEAVRIPAVKFDALGDVLFFDEYRTPNRSQFGLFVGEVYYGYIDIIHKICFNRFLHFGSLRGPPVEMTKAQMLITISIISLQGL